MRQARKFCVALGEMVVALVSDDYCDHDDFRPATTASDWRRRGVPWGLVAAAAIALVLGAIVGATNS